MSEQENTGLVQQAYGYFQSGDIPSVLDSLSEDVEWSSPPLEGVPVSGTWHGRAQVGQFFQTLGDNQEVRQFEPREFVAQQHASKRLNQHALLVLPERNRCQPGP